MGDCYQDPGSRFTNPNNHMTENRIYNNGGVSISYFQWHGSTHPPRGTSGPFTFANASIPYHPTCPPGQFQGHYTWSMSAPEFVSSLVRSILPTHLIISSGWWNPAPN